MITRLAHVGLVVQDIDAARANYAALLGCNAPPVQNRNNGYCLSSFPLENTALELISATTEAARAHLAKVIGTTPTPTTLAWHYQDVPPDCAEEVHDPVWRIPDNKAAGIKTFFVKEALGEAKGAITKMDHFVLNTPNPDRARAFYAGQLGLQLALEKGIASLEATIMFFRMGGLTMEVVNRPKMEQKLRIMTSYGGLVGG